MTSLVPSVAKVAIGNSAGWLLHFQSSKLESARQCVVSSDDVDGDIQATLNGGLDGSHYTFVLHGLPDDHYRALRTAFAAGTKDAADALTVDLYMFWRETVRGGPLAVITGISSLIDIGMTLSPQDVKAHRVASLHVQGLARQSGERGYETIVKATHSVLVAIDRTQVLGKELPIEDALHEVLETTCGLRRGADYAMHGAVSAPGQATTPADASEKEPAKFQLKRGARVIDVLRDVEKSLEKTSGRHGRGMFLVRDGVLHIGTREIALADARELELGNGLLEVIAEGKAVTDPNWGRNAQKPTDVPPTRDRYKLILRGRSDIRPGDVVRFELPATEIVSAPGFGAAIGGALLAIGVPGLAAGKGPKVILYVDNVGHRLGRTTGFVTTVSGVTLVENQDPWDAHSAGEESTDGAEGGAGSAADRAARGVERVARQIINRKTFPEIGEVRGVAPVDRGDNTVGQTLSVLYGLEHDDGRPHASRRIAIDRTQNTAGSGVPYLTPFAWGKCGLVLPNYPGSRVVALHRAGLSQEPIVAGALWEAGNAPDKAEFGDWWLTLPVGVTDNDAAEAAPVSNHAGKVTHDLSDAKGRRVIEVGEFTLRVKTELGNAGERPLAAEAQAITIEHSGGASIVLKKDGSITIKGQGITLDAGGGKIELKASKVEVI